MGRVNKTSPGVGGIIREAEKLIAAGRYEVAIQQLTRAQQAQPDNNYIRAIIERVSLLSQREKEKTNAPEMTSRYLSVTVGAEFKDGIKADTPDDVISPSELEERVRRLTSVAVNLFQRGSYDTAFDSLMKAYLLDPTSSHVIACERVLLPAIELMRKRGSLLSPTTVQPQTGTDMSLNKVSPPAQPAAAPAVQLTEEQRIQVLLRQKDQERTEKEREMWREASKPPRNSAMRPEMPSTHEPAPSPQPEHQRHSGGFFSKLKQGKFLG